MRHATLTLALCLGATLGLASSMSPIALAQPRDAGSGALPGVETLHGCATPDVVPLENERLQRALARFAGDHPARPGGGTIRVAFHVITADGEGDVSDAQIVSQIMALNRDYAATGYRFELASVDRSNERSWFRMTPGSTKELQAKRALARDPAHRLNVYTCAPGEDLIGWASFPWSAPEESFTHGVVLNYRSLPGGGIESAAASHEVGHYLGLVHEDLGGANAGSSAPSVTQIDRMQALVPLYRPSLFGEALGTAKDGNALTQGAEPEDGRVLAYRGAIPNPFQRETAIRFTLPSSQAVSLRIYSVTGQLVRTLVDAQLPPGDHSAMFRADNLPSGVYFSVLRAGRVQMSRTLVLVR